MSKPAPNQLDVERAKLVASIHVQKKELGYTNEQYRSLLMHVAGRDSCSKMMIDELRAVLSSMKKIKKPNAQDVLIANLWADLVNVGKVTNDQGLSRWLERMYKRSHVRFLTSTQKQRAIEALKQWLAR